MVKMDEKVNKKYSKKLTVMYLVIVLSIGVLAIVAVTYFVEPEEIPEDIEI